MNRRYGCDLVGVFFAAAFLGVKGDGRTVLVRGAWSYAVIVAVAFLGVHVPAEVAFEYKICIRCLFFSLF